MGKNVEVIHSITSYTMGSYSVYLKLVGTRNKSINSKRDKRKKGGEGTVKRKRMVNES